MTDEREPWSQFSAGKQEARVGSGLQLEHDAVGRIITRMGLSSQRATILQHGGGRALTFKSLRAVTGFPLRMRTVAFDRATLHHLGSDIMKRPGKSAVFVALEEFCDEQEIDDQTPAGIVFSWDRQRHMVFHNYESLELGSAGMWFTHRGRPYFTQSLTQLLSRLEAPELW